MIMKLVCERCGDVVSKYRNSELCLNCDTEIAQLRRDYKIATYDQKNNYFSCIGER